MTGCSESERHCILDKGWFVAPCPCDVLTRPTSHKSFCTRSTSTDVTIRINAKKTCSNCGAHRLTAPPGVCNFDGVSGACFVGGKEIVNRDSCPNLSHHSQYVLSPGGSTHQLPLTPKYAPCVESASVGSVPAAVLEMANRGHHHHQSTNVNGTRGAVQPSRSWHMMGGDTADSPPCDHVTKGSCPTRLDKSPPWSPRLSLLSGHSSPTFHLLNDAATRPVSPQCQPTAMSRMSPTSAMSRVSPTSAMSRVSPTNAMSRVSPTSAMSRVSPTSAISRVSPPTPPLITSPSVLAARRQCLFASSSSDDLHCGGCSGRTSPIYWELERPRSHVYSGPALVKSGRAPVSGLTSSMRKSHSDSGHSSPGVKSLSSSPEVVVKSRVTTDCGCGSHSKCPQKSPDHSRSLSSPLDVFSAIWRPGRRSHSTEVIGQKKRGVVAASVQSPGLDKQHRCQTPPRVLSPTNEVVTCEVIADI